MIDIYALNISKERFQLPVLNLCGGLTWNEIALSFFKTLRFVSTWPSDLYLHLINDRKTLVQIRLKPWNCNLKSSYQSEIWQLDAEMPANGEINKQGFISHYPCYQLWPMTTHLEDLWLWLNVFGGGALKIGALLSGCFNAELIYMSLSCMSSRNRRTHSCLDSRSRAWNKP